MRGPRPLSWYRFYRIRGITGRVESVVLNYSRFISSRTFSLSFRYNSASSSGSARDSSPYWFNCGCRSYAVYSLGRSGRRCCPPLSRYPRGVGFSWCRAWLSFDVFITLSFSVCLQFSALICAVSAQLFVELAPLQCCLP